MDEIRAQKLYTSALAGFLLQEQDEPNGQLEYRIGNMYFHAKGTQENAIESLRWFSLSADKGNAYAAYQAAELLADGKVVPMDEVRAQKLYASALSGFLLQEQEDPDKQLEYRIGNMYLNGKGIQKDMNAAIHWLSTSAERGNSYAAYQVGQILEEGKEVPRDDIQSQYFYRLALEGFIAAEQETPESSTEFRIAQMFYRGKGCIADFNAAFHWFSSSAEQNNPQAQFQLARMLQNGEGTIKNEQEAQKLYLLAFQGFMKLLQKEPDSGLQYKIGTMFEFGLGVKQDINSAKQWYRAAADSGNEYAADRLNQIEAYESQAAVGSIMSLLRAFSRILGNDIKDSTTHKYRQDHKLMQKQQTLKSSHGHKYDDQKQTM